ncbi:MAG: ATP-dependent sacrificial sulfur transferase LarE [Candidatus Gastranaerophilales bacterium]|nr:ATP-dependent sacrificial sulfur transferase LarE [Candidatus Gastranaerophilales bacterium]
MDLNFNSELKSKFSRLISTIKDYGSLCVAFSAGVDSTLLAFIVSNILEGAPHIVTVNSEFLSRYELEESKNLAQELGFEHKIIDISVMDNPDIIQNDTLRCKYCKFTVMMNIIEFAKSNGIDNILDGSNIDDLSDYRPGFEAASALGIKSPFIEAGISKEDIRELAKFLNLPNWDKPASACLASRIPYNSVITKDILEKVEKAEDFIRDLGYRGFRVRHYDKIARIELNADDIESFIKNHRVKVDLELRRLGYTSVCVDLKGYRLSGLNK